jgi:hypothetical protein
VATHRIWTKVYHNGDFVYWHALQQQVLDACHQAIPVIV